MKPRLFILILLIVAIPLGLLTWAAVRIARNERVVVQQQFRGLMEQRLRDVNSSVARHFQQIEATLLDLTSIDDSDVATLRKIGRTHPLVMQMFRLAPNGQLQYPDPEFSLNSDERSFLLRASRIFSQGHLSETTVAAIDSYSNSASLEDLPSIENEPADVERQLVDSSPAAIRERIEVTPESDTGWFVWYWDQGLNLVYWNRRPNGRIVGAALDRSRWMADLIGQLPDGDSAGTSTDRDRIHSPGMQLVNAATDVVYQWGNISDVSTEAVCEISLVEPLSSWRLRCLLPPDQMPGQSGSSFAGFAAGILAVAIALGLLAFVLVREYSRDMQVAGQQVSFVNQVSHELKTPLTNIRLYAELLDKDLDDLPEESGRPFRSRLNVILSEGQRLSRLIGNVLTLARQNRDALQLNPADCVPDDVITQVLKHFEPSLTALDVRLVTELNAAKMLKLDSDILEQILGNLISNVEKYAAASEQLTVRSRTDGSMLFVEMIDQGPGIPTTEQERVFDPFVRLSQDISSAAGTGIGLSISRRLAQEHGGNVRIKPSGTGCHFEVTLQATA